MACQHLDNPLLPNLSKKLRFGRKTQVQLCPPELVSSQSSLRLFLWTVWSVNFGVHSFHFSFSSGIFLFLPSSFFFSAAKPFVLWLWLLQKLWTLLAVFPPSPFFFLQFLFESFQNLLCSRFLLEFFWNLLCSRSFLFFGLGLLNQGRLCLPLSNWFTAIRLGCLAFKCRKG